MRCKTVRAGFSVCTQLDYDEGVLFNSIAIFIDLTFEIILRVFSSSCYLTIAVCTYSSFTDLTPCGRAEKSVGNQ